VAEKKTPVNKLSFSEAVAEVEGIVARLENEQTDVDELSEEVKRAVALITACRTRLEKTDAEVRDLVAKLEPAESIDDSPPPPSDDDEVPF